MACATLDLSVTPPRTRSSIDGRGGEQHRQAGARVARRGALLAQDDRRVGLARVDRRGDLLRDGARHPADLRAARVDGDRVRVVLVVRVAAQLERAARLGRVGGERLRVVAAGARDAGDPQAGGGQLRRVAAEVAAVGRDRLEAGQPDDPALVRVPVALLALDLDDHHAQRMRDLSGEHLAALAATVALSAVLVAGARRGGGVLAPRAAAARRGDPRRVRRRAARLRGARRVERPRQPAVPALRRGHARDRGRALAAAAAARRARLLLGVRGHAAGARHARPAPGVSGRPVLHLLRDPRRRAGGRVPAGDRGTAAAARGLRAEGVRGNRRVRRGRGGRDAGHRRQLPVPAPQAGRRLAARRDGPMAGLHRRGGALGLALFLALEAAARHYAGGDGPGTPRTRRAAAGRDARG